MSYTVPQSQMSTKDDPLTACVLACSKQKQMVACVSFDDFQECLRVVQECSGLAQTQKEALGQFCRACGEGLSRCAPAPISTPSSTESPPSEVPSSEKTTPPPKAKKSLTPEQQEEALCKKRGGVWYMETVNDPESGLPKLVTHCVTLKNVIDRVVKLEDLAHAKGDAPVAFSPEQLEDLERLHNMKLPPNLEQRLQILEGALDALCPKLKGDPQASLRKRCLAVQATIVITEMKADDAVARSKTAFEQSQLAHKRINEIRDQRTPEGDLRPKLRVSLTGIIHTRRTAITQDIVSAVGFEGAYLPPLTTNMRLELLAGIGKTTGNVFGSDRAVNWLGAGLAGPIAGSDFLAEGLLYLEHWYGANELSALNFYGVAGGVTWMPGSSTRKDQYPVLALGLRTAVGDMRTNFGNRGVADQFDASLAAHFLIAF
jgi:hypothetical protein